VSEPSPESSEPRPPPWRRRNVWIAAAAAVALYALLGFLVVPPIARSQIEKQARAFLHRDATVANVRFNPFTLRAVVEGLSLKDRDGSDLFRLDRFSADLQLSGLFRRAWRFRDVALEGPRAVGRVAADGRLSIADLFEPKPGETQSQPPAALPRVIVDHLAVRRGSAELIDETRSPRFVETVAPLDLELHALTTIPDESGDHAITLGLEGGARLRWSGRQTVEPLRLEGRIEIEGARLSRASDYFAASSPLAIHEGTLGLRCAYEILRGANRAFSIAIKDASLTLRDVAVRPRDGGDNWLVVPLLEVQGASVAWPESRVAARLVRVTEPRVAAWLEKDGTVNWQSAVPPKPAAPETPPSVWTASVQSVEVVKGSARFEDKTLTPSVVVDLTDLGLAFDTLTSDLASPVPVRLSAHVNGAGEAQASGHIVLDPASADLDLAVRDVALPPFAPYAIRLRGLDLRSGAAGASGKLRFGSGSPKGSFGGTIDVSGLRVSGGGTERLVACDHAKASGVAVTVLPTKIRVAKATLDGAFATLAIDREGRVNLKEALREKQDAAAALAAETSAPPQPAPPVDIGLITVRNASTDYTDLSVILPFHTNVHSINGTLKDLSTTSPAPATLALEGRISDTGYFKSDGTIRIGSPFAATDVTVIFRGVEMPELTPYCAEFAGYSIEDGSLDVDIHYKIQDGRLVGDHRVVAKDLTLGPKVEGAKGPPLPVRLAVSLLKDKNGRIDLEVPIEGTVSSPEFNYRSVCWQAVKTILGNVASAPFRAIGKMFGAGSEDLELVGFPAGRSDLPAPEQDKLLKVGAELAGRAELTLGIEGRFDPVKDVEALREAHLQSRIDARRDGSAELPAILEALYVESFSKERLEEERQKHPGEADAGALFDALRAQLLAADDVPERTLEELARARAAAIAAAVTAPGGLDPSRVKVDDPSTVKRAKRGSELVASELTLSAGD